LRILFYLPVVTPLWFGEVIVPLVRTLRAHAELHVLVPALWRNTGVGPAELAGCADLGDVHWHLGDGPDHEGLRTGSGDVEGLTAFVRGIAPDLVLCRSAETEVAAAFPGTVRYLMEAGAPPLAMDGWALALHEGIFDFGAMPELGGAEGAQVEAAFVVRWQAAEARFAQEEPYALPRSEALALMGLPDDRVIVAVPLEYAHEENFFPLQHRFARNPDLVAHLAARLPDDFVLALTDHPLNRLHGAGAELRAMVAEQGPRMRLVELAEGGGATTNLLAKHCDGMVVQNSKSFAAGAFFGKPMLRLSHRGSADWLRMYGDIDAFAADLRDGSAAVPDPDATRRWFAWRVLDEAFSAKTVDAAELLARVHTPFSPARWEGGLARYDQHQPRH